MLSQSDIQGLRSAGMPDDAILDALQNDDPSVNDDISGLKASGVPSTEILNNLDKLHSKKSGFLDAAQYGSAKALEGIGRTLQAFETTKGLGDSAMRYGQSIDNEQDYSPAGAQVAWNSPSSWGYIPRAIVEATPGAAASIGGGIAGAAAGGAVGGPVGAAIGGLAGAGLGGDLSYMGDRLQSRLNNNGQTNTPLANASTLDKLVAGGTAFGQGALTRVGVPGGALASDISGAGLSALKQIPGQVAKSTAVAGASGAAGDALAQAGDTAGTQQGLTVNPSEVASSAIMSGAAGGGARLTKGVVQDIPQSARFASVAQLPEAARDVANILQDTGENLSNPKGAYKALKSATDTLSGEAADNATTLKKNNAVDPNAADLIDATLKKLENGNTLSTDEMQAVSDTLAKTPGAGDLLDSIKRYQVLNTVKTKGNVDDSSKTVTGGLNASILGDITNPVGAVARKSPLTAVGLAAGGGAEIAPAIVHAIQHGGIDAVAGVTGLAPVIGSLIAAKLGLRLTDAATGFNAPVQQFASRFAQPGPNPILTAATAAKASQALLFSAPLGTTTPTARFGQLGSLGDDRSVTAKLSAPQLAPESLQAPAPIPGGVRERAMAAAARSRARQMQPQPEQQAQANAAPDLYRPTRNGVVQLPDADHAALFDFGENVSRRNLNTAALPEAQRLLNRFKGYVDDTDAPLANARDVGEMARDYYRDVFDNSRSGTAPDMMASDEARVAWLKRKAHGDDVAAIAKSAAQTKQALNGTKPKANGSTEPKPEANTAPAGDSFTYHGIEFPIPPDVKYRPAYIKSLKRNQDLINATLEKEAYNTANGMLDEKTYNAIEANRVALKTARNQDDARGVVNRIIKQAHPDDRAHLRHTFDANFFATWRKKSQGDK
jgi:hypothetical protein